MIGHVLSAQSMVGPAIASVGVSEIVRVICVVMTMVCFAAFTPAIVNARDNVDRLYLVGGVLFLAGFAYGNVARFTLPITLATPITVLGEIFWALSAWKSRARRKAREAGNARGGSSE